MHEDQASKIITGKNSIPRMLTINETAATGILTEHALRVMVAKNEIPHLKVGNRVLLNYDKLIEQLQAL